MTPLKPLVAIEALDALDIRVGAIDHFDDVQGSHKPVRLTVNFGDYRRMILVGTKWERADPREIEVRQALFVVNLHPRSSGSK